MLSDWIQENKNDFLRQVINYFLNYTASKILLTQQSIMMSKPLTCIEGLCLSVMENYKEKMCLIVKNCYGYKINFLSIGKNRVLSGSVVNEAQKVNEMRQLNIEKQP